MITFIHVISLLLVFCGSFIFGAWSLALATARAIDKVFEEDRDGESPEQTSTWYLFWCCGGLPCLAIILAGAVIGLYPW